MDFNLTEEQRAFQTLARQFAAEELTPDAKKWDETGFFLLLPYVKPRP